MVLAAAVVGLGVSSVAAVRTGTSSLATSIDSSLTGASAINGILILAGFVFTQHVAGSQTGVLEAFRLRDDELLLHSAWSQAMQAIEAYDAGDLDTAQYWTERLYLSDIVMRERGLNIMDTYPNAPNLNDLWALLDA